MKLRPHSNTTHSPLSTSCSQSELCPNPVTQHLAFSNSKYRCPASTALAFRRGLAVLKCNLGRALNFNLFSAFEAIRVHSITPFLVGKDYTRVKYQMSSFATPFCKNLPWLPATLSLIIAKDSDQAPIIRISPAQCSRGPFSLS